MKKLVVIAFLVSVSVLLKGQTFQGFDAFTALIEYEGQRWLMNEIYTVTLINYDKLKIEKTIVEKDSEQGFMFVLTSYVYNGNKGVVITSFNSVDFYNSKHYFTNIHLTDKEYTDLYNTFIEIDKHDLEENEHLLRAYNDRLIVDIHRINGFENYTLWVDINRRHTFTKSKWDKAYSRYQKFISN